MGFTRGIIFGFTSQLILYSIMLGLDLLLIEWYKQFYNAIQVKLPEEFIRQLWVFAGIVLAQASMLALLSFNSEIIEARLKKYYVFNWLSRQSEVIDNYNETRLDQRIIDDANLVSEKIAVILPSLIFNIVKSGVFLWLLAQYPTDLILQTLGVVGFENYGLSFFGVIYIFIQLIVLRKANSWVFKSENIKRSIEANTRYKLLLNGGAIKNNIVDVCHKYVKNIIKIRIIVGRAHGINVLAINGISSLSFLIPFIALFSSYSTGSITFGELMKISAIYSGFQMSAQYVFNTYREALKGVSALRRLQTM